MVHPIPISLSNPLTPPSPRLPQSFTRTKLLSDMHANKVPRWGGALGLLLLCSTVMASGPVRTCPQGVPFEVLKREAAATKCSESARAQQVKQADHTGGQAAP